MLLARDFSENQITSPYAIGIEDCEILTSDDNVQLLESPAELLIQDSNKNQITPSHVIVIDDRGILTSNDHVI